MDFKVEALAPCRKHVVVTISPERIAEEFETQYDEINDNVVLPGFRKGRTPRKLLEKRFSTTLGKEVKEKLVQAALEKLVEDEKVEPLRPPEIDLETLELEPEKPLSFEFDLVTKPEFDTPVYKEIELTVPGVEVTAEEIDKAIERARMSGAKLETVEDGEVQDEDVLVVDYEAMDGDSVEAHDDNAYYLFGRGVLAGFLAKGMDEQLKGQKAGAKATAEVRVGADDPREELRDRTFQLHVTLKEVKRYILPEIDAAFLEANDFDDIDEMRQEVDRQLRREKTRIRDRQAEEKLVEGLLDSVEISLPEEFVEAELENWTRRQRMTMEMEKVAEDEITKKIDAERGDAQNAVEKDMRRFFLLERIADEEEVKVTEHEMLQMIQMIAQSTGRTEEEVLSAYRDRDRLGELQSQIRHRKTGEIIRRQANITEGPPEKPADAPADEA